MSVSHCVIPSQTIKIQTMKKSIKELKEERSGIAQRMHEMLDAIEAREDKAFTDEERASYNNLKKQYETLNERIDLLEKEEARAAQAARPVSGTEPTAEERAATHQQELRSAFIDYIRGSVTKSDIKPELRADLFTGTADNQIIIPKLVSDQVVHALKAGGTFLGAIDLVITENAIPYVKSTLDTTSKALKKLAEGEANTTDKLQFKGIQINAYDYVTPIFPVHIALLEGTNVDVEATIVEAITNCVRRGLEELATRTGTGSDDINALLTAATKGQTTASATAITYDELVSLYASVDNAYGNSERGAFAMNSNTLAACLKIVDGNGRPIFITDVQTGEISRILGRRVIIDEAMPDIAAGAKPVAFGDFKYYHMRMVGGIRLTVFREKFADKLEIGFMGHVRADGDLIDAGTHPIKYLEMKSE